MTDSADIHAAEGLTLETVRRDTDRILSEIAGGSELNDPFAAAVHATRMPMIITDPRQHDNPIIFVNDAFCRLNGIDLAKEIRGMHPGLPVVLASGYSHVLAMEGTSGFRLLHKPYSIEELSRVLREASGRRRRAGVGAS